MKNDVHIFIPSYHRPNNLKTVKYFLSIGWDADKIHVCIDSATDDIGDYQEQASKQGFNLHVFDMDEARKRYDYVHRPSKACRSAGQARNMFFDIAKSLGLDFYVVQDDDTNAFQKKYHGKYIGMATIDDVRAVFDGIREMMQRRHIGLFGVSQTGDFIGGNNDKIYRKKVMNTTFYDTRFIYRGERGVQDDDTSLFVGVMNYGLFTGSLGDGLVLQQMQSAKQSGGLTDLYNECKLLNKSLVTPIQFPSAIYAEKQKMNGNRLHHHIQTKYLYPMILRNIGGRDNIGWDIYHEDKPFTNEKIIQYDEYYE